MTEILKFLKFQQLLKNILTVFSILGGLVQCLWVNHSGSQGFNCVWTCSCVFRTGDACECSNNLFTCGFLLLRTASGCPTSIMEKIHQLCCSTFAALTLIANSDPLWTCTDQLLISLFLFFFLKLAHVRIIAKTGTILSCLCLCKSIAIFACWSCAIILCSSQICITERGSKGTKGTVKDTCSL